MTKRAMKYILQIFDDRANLLEEREILPCERPKLSEAKVKFTLSDVSKDGTVTEEVVIKAKPQTTFSIYSGVWGWSTNTIGAANFKNLDPEKQIAKVQRGVGPQTKTPEPENDRVRSQSIIARILHEKITDDHCTMLELGIPVHEVFKNSEEITKKGKEKKTPEDQGTL
jgi:hypothetical protein